MPIGVVAPNKSISVESDTPVNWQLKAAGTYDLVNLDPQGLKRCAKRVVSLAADTWTVEDINGNSNTIAVPVNFEHRAFVRGITCAQPIAVYW